MELFAIWGRTYPRVSLKTLSVPTREGYRFKGWGTTSTATEIVNDIYTMITTESTLYAVWVQPDFVMPDFLTDIEEEAFMGGAFTFVKLSDNTASIGARAFADCPNLAYIWMPSGVTVDPTAIPENVAILYLDPAD
jgi:uncharacterized repeat protein (TIGR02543 family)